MRINQNIEERGAQKAVNLTTTSFSTSWLKASSRQVLQKIVFLSVLHALKKQRCTRSCFPGRKYFADATGLHQSTISDITTELQNLGLIEKFQRRPEHKMFSTCLYKLSGVIRAIGKSVTIEFLRLLNRVAFSPHIVSKDHRITIPTERNAENGLHLKSPPLTEYLTRLSLKFGYTG